MRNGPVSVGKGRYVRQMYPSDIMSYCGRSHCFSLESSQGYVVVVLRRGFICHLDRFLRSIAQQRGYTMLPFRPSHLYTVEGVSVRPVVAKSKTGRHDTIAFHDQ